MRWVLGRLLYCRHGPTKDGRGVPGHEECGFAPTVIWFRPGEGVPATAVALGEAGVEILRPGNASNYLYLRDPEGRLLGFHEPG